jgi:G:T/U-mismatch repair DNA glycosylase
MLLRAKEVARLQRPSNRDWRSVKHWILEKAPLVQREQQFILRKEDLVTLRSGREGAGFESLVERMLSKTDSLLQSYRCNLIQVREYPQCHDEFPRRTDMEGSISLLLLSYERRLRTSFSTIMRQSVLINW